MFKKVSQAKHAYRMQSFAALQLVAVLQFLPGKYTKLLLLVTGRLDDHDRQSITSTL